jgi:hypothetical protein
MTAALLDVQPAKMDKLATLQNMMTAACGSFAGANHACKVLK